MLHHIVMWKLKDHAAGADRATNVRKARTLLEGCAALVPGVHRFELAVAEAGAGLECTCDLVLHSTFTDREALAGYQNHPDHVAIKPFMKAVVEARQCMDYQT